MSKPRTTIRDADWCDQTLAKYGVIFGERIHLTRKLRRATGYKIEGCHITTDFVGWFMEGDVPEIVASWSADTGLLFPGGSWS